MSFLDVPGVKAAALDAAVRDEISDAGSLTRGELNATYGPDAVGMKATFVGSAARAVVPVSFDVSSMNALNAAAPLSIPSPVPASSEVVHPAVAFDPLGWNGYRYWMGFTPYPNSDSGQENPCIVASNDGQNWVVPAGLTNPLEVDPGGDTYYSDPHLTWGPDGRLYLTFRLSADPQRIIYMRSSADGVTWTAKTAILTADISTSIPASQAIVYDGKQWIMLYVESVSSPNRIMRRTATAIAGTWSAPTDTGITAPTGKQLWHMDAQFIAGTYYSIINVTDVGSQSNGQLYLATSSDSVAWVRGASPLMNLKGGAWDAGLYRATGFPIYSGGAMKLAIWYSAFSAGQGWQIGYAEAASLTVPVKGGGDEVFISAQEFQSDIGAATLGKTASARIPAWLLDSATTEQLHTIARVPTWWKTYDIYYLWSNDGAGTGNVVFGCKRSTVLVGTTLATGDVDDPSTTVAALGQNVLAKTRVRANLAIPEGGFVNLRMLRRGADAGDTLANDAAFLGAVLTRIT